MNFGDLIAKGGALFARKGADALADTLEAASPADLARIQASVSESPFVPLQRYQSLVSNGDWAPALAQLFADYGATTGACVLLPRAGIVLKSWPLIPTTADTAPRQKPFLFIGSGAHMTGRNEHSEIWGSTVIDLQFADSRGKIKTNGLGLLGFQDCTITDSTDAAGALIYTTNTTLLIQRVAFMGNHVGSSATQDAIILGGPDQVEGGGGWDDGFQGYGTVIRDNYFGKVRRAVYGRAFANGVTVVDNTIWGTCGGGAGVAAIEFDGQPTGAGSQYCAGNKIAGNLIESPGYVWSIRLKRAIQNEVWGNTFFDADEEHSLAAIRLESDCSANVIMSSYVASGLPHVDEVTIGANTVIDNRADGQSNFSAPSRFHGLATANKIRVVGGVDGLVVQPDTSPGGEGYVARFVRSAAETVEPNLDIFSVRNDGVVSYRKAQFVDDGNTWKNTTKDGGGNIVGGPLKFDTGSGGSYEQHIAYGYQYLSYTPGNPVRGTMVPKAKGLDYINCNLLWKPGSSVVPDVVGSMTFEATSDSTLTVKLKGSDGVVRAAMLTLV